MRVLITGSNGFCGRRFVKRFLDQGHEVTCVDNLSTGKTPDLWMFKPNDISKMKMMFCDVRTYFNTAKAAWFDLVIHLAAVVGGRLNIENDPLGVATDLSIDAEMFNWAVRVDPKKGERMPRVIYFSSSAVYPIELQTEKCNVALAEALQGFESPRIGMPDFTYGWSKLSGEYLAKYAAEKYKLDVKIYRPFGGYGEDQDMSYPFPAIIKRALDGNDPVIIWGSGDQRRDFIHIEDVVDCVMATWEILIPGEVLNIGTGEGTSFYELAYKVRDVLGLKFNIKNDVSKPEGVFSRVCDPYKMRKWYTPTTTLEEGIEMVAEAIAASEKKQAVG
jgi:nucleoside-diphosphate-sugar epimerase